jgi:hypothetical protein
MYQFKQILKGERSIVDIFYYFQGKIRYKLFYSRFKGLLSTHIKEQILYRIGVMNPICRKQGSCIKCGCETTALQMCNKACDGNCYPPMMNAVDWNCKSSYKIDEDTIWLFNPKKRMYELFTIKGNDYVKVL